MRSMITADSVAKMNNFFDPPEAREKIESYLGSEPTSVLLMGHSGSGKSTLAAGFPGLLVCQADNKGAGLPEHYRKRSRTFKHGEKVYETIMTLLRNIEADYERTMKEGIKTVVIDTFSAFCEYMEVEILNDPILNAKGTVMMQIPHYGVIGQRIGEIVRVAKEVGVHLVCIAHIDDSQNGPDGFPIFMPSLTGRKIEGKVPGKFDHVMLMTNKEGVFTTQLKPTTEFPHAKLGMKPSMYKEAPAAIKDMTYKKLNAILDGTIKGKGGKA